MTVAVRNNPVQLRSSDEGSGELREIHPVTLVENIKNTRGEALSDLLGKGGSGGGNIDTSSLLHKTKDKANVADMINESDSSWVTPRILVNHLDALTDNTNEEIYSFFSEDVINTIVRLCSAINSRNVDIDSFTRHLNDEESHTSIMEKEMVMKAVSVLQKSNSDNTLNMYILKDMGFDGMIAEILPGQTYYSNKKFNIKENTFDINPKVASEIIKIYSVDCVDLIDTYLYVR